MAIPKLSPATYNTIALIPALAMILVGNRAAPIVMAAALVPALVWALVFFALAWRRLDETGREAHKFAWLWGGGAALVLALGFSAVVILLPIAGAPVRQVLAHYQDKGPPGEVGFALGLFAAAMIQVIGYLIAWSVWWLVKRR